MLNNSEVYKKRKIQYMNKLGIVLKNRNLKKNLSIPVPFSCLITSYRRINF